MLLGITERLEFVDAPGHAEDLARYRARGDGMEGNRIRLVMDRPMEVVEVHAPSANSVNMAGVTREYYPPVSAAGWGNRKGSASSQEANPGSKAPDAKGITCWRWILVFLASY